MKHILFPTDFSDNSSQAFPYALDIALLLGADLVIFNAYQLPHSKSNVMVSIVDRMKEDSQNELEILKDKALSQEKYKNLKITITSRSGNFTSQIPKVANEFKSELIVIGTKGASSLKEIFIGRRGVQLFFLQRLRRSRPIGTRITQVALFGHFLTRHDRVYCNRLGVGGMPSRSVATKRGERVWLRIK